MEWQKAKIQSELNSIILEFKEKGEHPNLDLREWDGGSIDLELATTGNICLEGATTGYIYLELVTTGDIYLAGATTGSILLNEATTGNIYLAGATTGNILLNEATTGDIYLAGATTGNIDLRGATTWDIIQNYSKEAIEFLKRLPLHEVDMRDWHSDDDWLGCQTIEDANSCGTTHCIRGWAEVEYYFANGRGQHPDPDNIYPELKYLFHMNKEQATKEIEKILENNQ